VRDNLTALIWKESEMCTYWQICINHQQKATFVTNFRKIKNLSLLKTTVSTCSTLTKVTKRLTAIQLVGEYEVWREEGGGERERETTSGI
jgi:hypothetical protein